MFLVVCFIFFFSLFVSFLFNFCDFVGLVRLEFQQKKGKEKERKRKNKFFKKSLKNKTKINKLNKK